ncbi:MAG: hypothetical protein JRJ49_00360 [Deltaproteobacteria bacterium]|nr:hypothetical protein [Deltaproteobacteria bacterium]
MSIKFKIILTVLMIIGFGAGFCDTLFLEITVYDLERIHIFFLIYAAAEQLFYVIPKQKIKFVIQQQPFFTLVYICHNGFFKPLYCLDYYLINIGFYKTETVRMKKFSFFPFQFFKSDVLPAEKFHNASLLCLSIGLVLSVFAIINRQYYQVVHSDQAELNTFFLDFSFPLSLITFSLIFSFIKKTEFVLIAFLKNISF